MRQRLAVSVNIDVEEEGLFSGRYKCANVPLNNVSHLKRLAPLIGRGAKPTLFCAWPVLTDAKSLKILEKLAPDVEIGVHLHHWNTPPIVQNIPASGELLSVPASQVPLQCLDSKIEHLFRAGRDFLGENPTSFRMGRWDLHREALPLLARRGVLVDASVRPLHSHFSRDVGPDHFSAPSDPYRISLPAGEILEVPLTVAPIFAPFAHIPAKFGRFRASVKRWGALALLPVMHPLWLMRLVTNLHVNGGGKVLSLTWHSSEMMPGGAPHMRDKASVEHFIRRIDSYLDWLEQNFDVEYLFMSDLRRKDAWPLLQGSGDWTWAEEK